MQRRVWDFHLLNKVGSKLWFILTFPSQPPSRPDQLQTNGGTGIKICFCELAAAKIPPEAFFLHLGVFFLAIFYSSPDPGEASAWLEMSKSCVASSTFWSLGFLRRQCGVVRAVPSVPQAVGYICSLCCNLLTIRSGTRVHSRT